MNRPFSVVEAVDESIAAKIKKYPVTSNTASKIGHPCLRYLVLRRTHWDRAPFHSLTTQYIFEAGKVIEEAAIREINGTGRFRVTETDVPLRDDFHALSGRLDGKIEQIGSGDKHPTKYPLEIKGLNPWDFDAVNSEEDMLNSTKPWIRGYPAQLLVYLYLTNIEQGLFYIKNKANNRPKEIWVSFNEKYAKEILAKCVTINAIVDHISGKPEKEDPLNWPDPIPWAENICGYCEFVDLCLPTRNFGNGMLLAEDPELVEMVNELKSLDPQKKAWDKLDRMIKDKLKAAYKVQRFEECLIGDWMISASEVSKAAFTVPASTYTKFSIKPTKAGEDEDTQSRPRGAVKQGCNPGTGSKAPGRKPTRRSGKTGPVVGGTGQGLPPGF